MVDDFYQLSAEEQFVRLLTFAARALAHWPLEPLRIFLIKYRENAVFRFHVANNQNFILRIHRPGYHSTAAISSELKWIAAVAEAGLDVPKIIPTKRGELFIQEEHDDLPEPRLIDVFELVKGKTMRERIAEEKEAGNFEKIVFLFGQAGELMAQLHNHAAVWQPPAGFTRHAWDADGLVGEQPFWGRFWEFDSLSAEQKELMVIVRDRLRQDLADFPKSADTYSLIHADFNLDNLLVDGDRVRVIDFDDAGFGWHLFDIATLFIQIEKEPFEQAAKDAFFDGYRRHRPLSEAHLNHLPTFVTARQLTYLGWAQDRQEIAEIRERTQPLIAAAVRAAEVYLMMR